MQLNSSYPGGLAAYTKNARALLQASKVGANPFHGLVPSVRHTRCSAVKCTSARRVWTIAHAVSAPLYDVR